MINIKKAISEGKVEATKREQERLEKAAADKRAAEEAEKERLIKLQCDVANVMATVEKKIADTVANNQTTVRIHGWEKVDPDNLPEMWKLLVEACEKEGIKAQVMTDSFEDSYENPESGHYSSWWTYRNYLGIDLNDYKIKRKR